MQSCFCDREWDNGEGEEASSPLPLISTGYPILQEIESLCELCGL